MSFQFDSRWTHIRHCMHVHFRSAQNPYSGCCRRSQLVIVGHHLPSPRPRGFTGPGKLDEAGFKVKIKQKNLPGRNPALTRQKNKKIPQPLVTLPLVEAASMAAADPDMPLQSSVQGWWNILENVFGWPLKVRKVNLHSFHICQRSHVHAGWICRSTRASLLSGWQGHMSSQVSMTSLCAKKWYLF